MISFPLSVGVQQCVRVLIYYLNQVFDKCYHYSSIEWHTQRFVRDVIYYPARARSEAESARAVTGRRNSHSGRGEDFLSRQPDFFTETAVTPERKVEKSFPRWEINRHAEG